MNIASVLCLAILSQTAAGLEQMFETTSKDFGQVPRGSVSIHNFVLKNTTDAEIRVGDVRSTCRCATPRAVNTVARPGEDLVIEVKYDTTTFVGPRSMTIYVTFQQPTHETVSLRVNGYSRSDVVFNPSQVDFGVVSRGSEETRKVKVEYAGPKDFRISSVLPSPTFKADVKELYRQPGRIGYEVAVTLPREANAGMLNEALQLKTNDDQTSVLSLHAVANVMAPLVASPNSLQLGAVNVGQKVTKQILLRGDKPFSIKAIGGYDEGTTVLCSQGARKVHLIKVEFEGKKPGKVEQTIEVFTDMEKEDPLPLNMFATVQP